MTTLFSPRAMAWNKVGATLMLLCPCCFSVQPEFTAQPGELVPRVRKGLHFELFLPAAWTAAEHHPVLVFLHGRGESGGFDVTNAQSLPSLLLNNRSFAASFPFVTVVPQCPSQCAMANHWSPHILQSISALLFEFVLSPNGLGGDAERVYLAGQSMGGHGAWMYAAQQPRLFAALVVVCGYLQGRRETREVMQRLAHDRLPVAVFHAADDVVIPVDASDDAVAALRASGYSDHETTAGSHRSSGRIVRYTRYDHAPGPPMAEYAHLLGHGSYELAFRDPALYRWLLSHSCRTCINQPALASWNELQ